MPIEKTTEEKTTDEKIDPYDLLLDVQSGLACAEALVWRLELRSRDAIKNVKDFGSPRAWVAIDSVEQLEAAQRILAAMQAIRKDLEFLRAYEMAAKMAAKIGVQVGLEMLAREVLAELPVEEIDKGIFVPRSAGEGIKSP